MSGSILITIGLVLDIVGVWILANGVIMDADKAKQLASTRWNGNKELEEQFRQSAQDTRRGVCILIVGFILQIAGTLLPWLS